MFMNHCPVCNALIENQRVCRRCKADLGQLMDMENDALQHRQKALRAFEQHQYHEMFFHAGRSRSLLNTSDSSRIFASAAMLTGQFDLAYFLWRQTSHKSHNTNSEK